MEKQTCSQRINNEFYDDLGVGWYTASNHPIALLRAENAVRVPWIQNQLKDKQKVLDIGCGAGILTNALAKEGHSVFGVDVSKKSLEIAKKYDATKTVQYHFANAYSLPFGNEEFDVVCAMDVLEHVENPALLIKEAARVLKPGGTFFFHTFNRNWMSFFLVIKGVDWCVPNAPKNMHVYPLFIKPQELQKMCKNEDLKLDQMHGFSPKVFSFAFLKMLIFRKIPESFTFRFSKSLLTGYCGSFKKIQKEDSWSQWQT